MRITAFTIGLLVCLVVCINISRAEISDEMITPCMEQDLMKAQTFIISFKNDSAVIVLRPLIDDLVLQGQLDSPFGLQVQLAEATALEADRQEEKALHQLLHVKELSEQQKLWENYTKACLVLALLYEKFDRDSTCWENLQQARSTIQNKELYHLYPRYAVRTASYYRVFNISRDSALFYAQEALRTAPLYNQQLEQAIGHLLMGMLLSDTSYWQSADHLRAAGKIYYTLEDYTLYSSVMKNLSILHFKNNQPRLALVYNDSTIAAANIAAAMGTERHSALYIAYKLRGEIYRELEQFDSAWHYIQQGQQLELEHMQKDNLDKVVEVEARFNDVKKEQQIVEQARQIHFERSRRNWFLASALVALLFAAILAFLYIRLRAANRKNKYQALVLSHVNEELTISLKNQLLLQGEIHHRVKNNLQVIISLLELQKEDFVDPATRRSFDSMSGRIYSMAAIHEILYLKEGTRQVNLLDYTQDLCHHISTLSASKHKPIFNIDIDPWNFSLETLMPLGIILNELLTNSFKYAVVQGRTLSIGIRLTPYADSYCLHYSDNGPGFPQGSLQDREGGLGSYLLSSMCRQLNGRLESMNDQGAVYKIFFKEKNSGVGEAV